jgi:hypothetical protein
MPFWLPRKIDYDVNLERPVRQTAPRRTPRQSTWQRWSKCDRFEIILPGFFLGTGGVFFILWIIWQSYMANTWHKYDRQAAAIPLSANESFPPALFVEPGEKRPIERDFCKLFAEDSTWVLRCENGLLVGGKREEGVECYMVVEGSDKEGWLEPSRSWKVMCSETLVASVDEDLRLRRYNDLKVEK